MLLGIAALSVALAADPPVDTVAVAVDAPKSPALDLENLRCRHAFGVAAGTYRGSANWNDVGTRWGTSFSPVYQAMCVEAPVDDRVRHAFAGVTMAPWYVQFRVLDGVARHQWATALIGVSWGEQMQIGPFVTFGYAGAGAGLTFRSAGAANGSVIEAQLTGYGPVPGVQALLTYGFVSKKHRPKAAS